MNGNGRKMVSQMERHLEETWSLLDDVLGRLSPDDWARQHGPDWTFADVPWHMAYIDRLVVAEALEAGSALPEEKRLAFASTNELNAWNRKQLEAREAEIEPDGLLARMRESREACRKLIRGMTDEELDEPAWFPIMFNRGWRTKMVPLVFCLQHTFGHVCEAHVRLGLEAPKATPELLQERQKGIFNFMTMAANPEAASEMEFTMVMRFTEPGEGAWTLEVDHGRVTSCEGDTPGADLVMTMAPYTFEKMTLNAINPIWGMITRKIKVNGLRNMGKFGQLMTPLPPDQPVEAAP